MVSGWFPSPTCAPILPTSQIRKRWHRRILDRLNQLTLQDCVVLLSVLAVTGTCLFALASWACLPLSEYIFAHCARSGTTSSVSATPLAATPSVPVVTSSTNMTHLTLASLRVQEGKALAPNQQFIFGEHTYRISKVSFDRGLEGTAEIQLELRDKVVEAAGVRAPVDENEAKEDILFGVLPSRRKAYQKIVESENFECASGGQTIHLPLSKINDDYCDCSDGSDEPGTSACQGNGKFFCAHTGELEQTVWSTAVNDGICDCCDGSDESTSGVQCHHIC
eukprot:TRINITY_DN56730_c0_g1_i4.p1 TRINITY_DN56730_c0_g1~~TRINITY_DN56730_c0_g1_i4.p1  ORF type:complete len:279 (-),score=40.17 TRINITY_DN56730_c0_g1_i4:262-1098(-)